MSSQQDPGSHLFLVRFWSEGGQGPQDRKQWRGRVQHVLSGESRGFHDWATLIELLVEMAESDEIAGRAQGTRTQEAT